MNSEISSEITSGDKRENMLNEAPTDIEDDEYERQIIKNRRCHPIWGYFSWSKDYNNVVCNLCGNPYSSNTGVSTIKGHFMNYHKDEWKEIEQTKFTISSTKNRIDPK
ncbi:13704_t:CDS:2 [Dentiscutata erythropus]|uniref:13704_t:CDS:1 n=1 Tax=Dentiscutata erythropus TaxID=1348616 RepID=A0A9N9GKL5_9GLOM|nr:13704_t:CDS:2 [Dentiscutata erythropus]